MLTYADGLLHLRVACPNGCAVGPVVTFTPPRNANASQCIDAYRLHEVWCGCGWQTLVDPLLLLMETSLEVMAGVDDEAFRITTGWHRRLRLRWGPVDVGEVLEYELLEDVLPFVLEAALSRRGAGGSAAASSAP